MSLEEQMKMLYAVAFGRRYDEAASWLVKNYFHGDRQDLPESTDGAGTGQCTVIDRQGRQCQRMAGHTQRHRYV